MRSYTVLYNTQKWDIIISFNFSAERFVVKVSCDIIFGVLVHWCTQLVNVYLC